MAVSSSAAILTTVAADQAAAHLGAEFVDI
jgi:hypothetical protein